MAATADFRHAAAPVAVEVRFHKKSEPKRNLYGLPPDAARCRLPGESPPWMAVVSYMDVLAATPEGGIASRPWCDGAAVGRRPLQVSRKAAA